MAVKKTESIRSDRKPTMFARRNNTSPIRLLYRKKSEDHLAIAGMLGQVKDDTESLLKMVEEHIGISSFPGEKK